MAGLAGLITAVFLANPAASAHPNHNVPDIDFSHLTPTVPPSPTVERFDYEPFDNIKPDAPSPFDPVDVTLDEGDAPLAVETVPAAEEPSQAPAVSAPQAQSGDGPGLAFAG